MRFDIIHVHSFSVCFCMRSAALNPLAMFTALVSLDKNNLQLKTEWVESVSRKSKHLKMDEEEKSPNYLKMAEDEDSPLLS